MTKRNRSPAGLSVAEVVAMAVLSLSIRLVLAMQHDVGDGCASIGVWSPDNTCDYNAWADTQTFAVGDTLVFTFDENQSDVAVVSLEEYNTCSGGEAPTTFISEYILSPHTFFLTTPGTYYIVSLNDLACSSDKAFKQQVTITVVDQTTGDAPSEAPSSWSPSWSSSPGPGPADQATQSASSSSLTNLSTSKNSNSPSSPASSPPSPAPASSSTRRKSSVVGAAVGGSVGFFVLAAKLSLIAYCARKKRNQKRRDAEAAKNKTDPFGSSPVNVTHIVNIHPFGSGKDTTADSGKDTTADSVKGSKDTSADSAKDDDSTPADDEA